MSTYLRRGSAAALAAVSLTLMGAASSQAARTPRPTVPPTTVAPPTTTAPLVSLAAPTNLRLRYTTGFFAPTPTGFSVIWNSVLGATRYIVFLNGVNRGTDTCSGGPYCFDDDFISAGFRNLTPGTTYTVTVQAVGNGTISPFSAPFVFTTPLA